MSIEEPRSPKLMHPTPERKVRERKPSEYAGGDPKWDEGIQRSSGVEPSPEPGSVPVSMRRK